ncbi:MAG: class I SAM-dependent methyltransferase, partial [Chloroflexi bacterium]
GLVTTIDRRTGPDVRPLLARAGLDRFVDAIRAEHSYTWELMRLIEAHTVGGRCRPPFDLCFVDGAHSWDTDGFAFFLVEKLLRPGGWIVFDDLDWAYANATDLAPPDAELAALMSGEARSTTQVSRVFELLVRQHPAMDVVRVYGRRGWARKTGSGDPEAERLLVERLLHWIPPAISTAARNPTGARRTRSPREPVAREGTT